MIVESVGADYAAEERGEAFKESISWLAEYYEVPYEFYPISGAEAAAISKESLMKGLEREKSGILEKVRAALEMGDLDGIAYWCCRQKGFYFYLAGEIMNPMDLLTYLSRYHKGSDLYVVQTFDYHF
ncbi:MAG: hypothetical protein QW561_00125 [Candidatus Aenigmatarchaeota archaeon]